MTSRIPEGYEIRPLAAEDGPAMGAAMRRNREHLAERGPLREERFFTDEGQVEVVAGQVAEAEEGRGYVFVIEYDGAIVGRSAIVNIVRGPMQSATLSYWVDVDHQGRGLAVALAEHAAGAARDLGLHRLEAGTMLDNIGSQIVLQRAGFTEYGIAERLLFIRGMWRDHRLFQRILHDDPLEV